MKNIAMALIVTYALLWSANGAADGDVSVPLRQAYQKGVESEKRKDYPRAAKWYRGAAEKGDPACQCALGYLYLLGLGVAKDAGEARKWFQKSAAQGYAPAQSVMGMIYEHGAGVKTNYVEAMRFYQMAAAHGDADAKDALGRFRIGPADLKFLGEWDLVSSDQRLPDIGQLDQYGDSEKGWLVMELESNEYCKCYVLNVYGRYFSGGDSADFKGNHVAVTHIHSGQKAIQFEGAISDDHSTLNGSINFLEPAFAGSSNVTLRRHVK